MFDRPPPSTMASGSSRLMTCARPRARRSAWRARAAGRAGRPRRRGLGQAAGVVRVRAVAVARQAGAGDEGLQAAAQAAPALRAGVFGRESARAAGCGPTRRPRRAGRDAPARPPRCRRRAGAEDDAEHQAVAGAGAVGASDRVKQLASFSTRTSRPSRRADVRVERMAVQRGGVGVLHQPGGGADHAGNADADGGGHAELRLGVAHQLRRSPSRVAG